MSPSLQRVDLDSEIFGRPTFMLSELSTAADFEMALEHIAKVEEESYTVCKIPIENMVLIHLAQERGFVFLETQFRTVVTLKHAPLGIHDRYSYIRVEQESQLSEVLAMASESVVHDRVSRDPLLGPTLSGERYRRLLIRSFEADDEEIWAVVSSSSNDLLTFRSHRKLNRSEVLLLNGGVHPRHKGSGLGVISSHFCFAQLQADGHRRAISHISTTNVPIVNLEIGYCKFRVTDAFAVLRLARWS